MLFYIIYNNIIWTCIIAALVGAGAATLFFLLKGNKKKVEDVEEDASPKNPIVAGIRNNAEAFAGLYEAMYSISCGKVGRKREVFGKWTDAVTAVGDAEMLEAFTKKCGGHTKWKDKQHKKFKKAAKKLVKCFFKAGVVRSDELYIVGDSSTAERYYLAGDGMITADENYEVLAPYWQFEDTVLEKGVIK